MSENSYKVYFFRFQSSDRVLWQQFTYRPFQIVERRWHQCSSWCQKYYLQPKSSRSSRIYRTGDDKILFQFQFQQLLSSGIKQFTNTFSLVQFQPISYLSLCIKVNEFVHCFCKFFHLRPVQTPTYLLFQLLDSTQYFNLGTENQLPTF